MTHADRAMVRRQLAALPLTDMKALATNPSLTKAEKRLLLDEIYNYSTGERDAAKGQRRNGDGRVY